MSDVTRNTIGAGIGAATGTGASIAGSTALVSAVGTTAGLWGPGITSGLAAIGGTMVGGVAVIAAETAVLAALSAYGCYRLAKWLGRGLSDGTSPTPV